MVNKKQQGLTVALGRRKADFSFASVCIEAWILVASRQKLGWVLHIDASSRQALANASQRPRGFRL